jgi:translation initiation factor IF-2
MAKIRVYELARQLNTTNQVLLGKLTEMNIPVKSHMSGVEESVVPLLKEALFGNKAEVVVERRVRGSVIRRRKKVIKKPVHVDETPPAAEPETGGTLIPGEEPRETAPVEGDAGEVTSVKPPDEAPTDREETAEDKTVPPEQIRPSESEGEKMGLEAEGRKDEPKPSRKAKRKKVEKPAKIIRLPEKEMESVPEIEGAPDLKAGAVPDEGEPTPGEMMPPLHERETPGKEKKGKKRRVSSGEETPDKGFFKKKISYRKKEVLEKSDLYEGKLAAGRKGRKPRKGKIAIKGKKTAITTPKAIKRRIKIDDAIMVSDLAKRMGIKASEVIKELMRLGVMASLNHAIDFETASVVANEFEYEVERAAFEEEGIVRAQEDTPDKLKPRPPVVTIMGHVDHGKTSLLDAIRQTNVIDGEAGGITQHIGAYCVTLDDRQIVFLDTPGHEAFTAMRARGANVTDLVVLVVAADDGVMPQTIEAINHAKAAGVPVLATVNKIDKPQADPDRVKRELAEQGLNPEEWGGDTVFVHVSAKERIGLEELLEMILLQADLLELKANPDKQARGRVIEAKLDVGRGPVATMLVQEGTLHTGDALVCGPHYGKIRAMFDDRGNRLDSAGPSMAVELQGLSGVPMAGDEFVVVADEKVAKQVGMHRVQKQRVKDLAKSSTLTLEKYYEQMKDGIVKDLNLIIRADVQGSVEALTEAVANVPSTEVKVNVVHSAAGTMSESDVMLATVSNAIIVGFNVRPNPKVRDLAHENGVEIKFYDVIYNVVNDIKKAIVGLMEPTYEEHLLGRAEVRETFNVAKVGTVAGCYVTDGKIDRAEPVRLLRDGVVICDGKVGSLRRFKDDVKEVQKGYECGIGIENYNDIKVGDVIECYQVEEIKPSLE